MSDPRDMRPLDTWLYRRYRQNLHRPMRPRPPRASSVELPYLLAAHLWCWVFITAARIKARGVDGKE